MAVERVTQWSGLSHIPGVDDGTISGLPEYLDPEDKIRLSAYRALAAYLESCRRELMVDDPNRPGESDRIREFGYPSAYAETIAGAILGARPEMTVIGADLSLPARPSIPPAPEEPEAGLPELEAQVQEQIYSTAGAAWAARAARIIAQWTAQLERQPRLEARQDWLRNWASPDQEDLFGKLTELEHEYTVPLGDGVLLLGWDTGRGRPSVRVFEPDVYFPVLDETLETFPDKVHLAWIFVEEDDQGTEVEYVRRITYELAPIDPADEDYEPFVAGAKPKYLGEGQEQTHACLYSNGVWELADFERVYDVETQGVVWEQIPDPSGSDALIDAERVDIGLDFIPIVHFPHTLSTTNHYGRSPITRHAQVFDQMSRADTGEALSAAFAAEPVTVLRGLAPGSYEENEDGTVGVPLYPGRALASDSSGGVEHVDMAGDLEAIGRYVQRLRDETSNLLAIPKALMGRVEAADIASGIVLELLFQRFQQSIERARLARSSKWPLIGKMVQRIEIQNSERPFDDGSDLYELDTEVYPATVTPGRFMPSDTLAAANVVKLLRDSRAISQESALREMEAKGFSIDDIMVELARLRQGDADTALDISMAVGPKWAARWLGLRAWDEEDLPDAQVAEPSGAQGAGAQGDEPGDQAEAAST